MKTSRNLIQIGMVSVISIVLTWVCVGQTSAPAKKPITGDSNPALDQLNALVSYLEANNQTNALKLFNEYSSCSLALQDSAEMGVTVHILVALREGRTNDVIKLLETRLDSHIVGFVANYKQMPKTHQEWLGLHSLSEAQWYRNKFPNKDADGYVTQAFELLDKKDNK
jgi:hypothetical protein